MRPDTPPGAAPLQPVPTEAALPDHAVRNGFALVLCSMALAALLHALHVPASMLLGSMLVAIAFALRTRGLRVPSSVFGVAQGLLGCLMARSLQPAVLQRVAHDWPLFLGFTLLVLGASAVLGYTLARRHVLPGTTAVWGLAPGAASAMVVMADAYGADARLVALMQYLRVVMVTLLASLVSGLWAGHAAPAAPADRLAWSSAATLLLALGGMAVARVLRISAGALLLPLVSGIALQSLGWLTIELPAPLLGLAYAVLGWSVGLRFTRPILNHAWNALPSVLSAILALIALGLLLACALVLLGGFDPLTAYLATSPGGADSVAVIAASAAVDAGFVMAMQLARFIMVFLFGPRLFQWIAKRALPRTAQ